MTPVECFATTLAAAAALHASYHIIMWLADRVIDGIADLARYE